MCRNRCTPFCRICVVNIEDIAAGATAMWCVSNIATAMTSVRIRAAAGSRATAWMMTQPSSRRATESGQETARTAKYQRRCRTGTAAPLCASPVAIQQRRHHEHLRLKKSCEESRLRAVAPRDSVRDIPYRLHVGAWTSRARTNDPSPATPSPCHQRVAHRSLAQ